jgi:hypothetical protein
MDENRARITVMAKDRRILQRHYTFILPRKQSDSELLNGFATLKLLIFSTTDAGLFSSPIFNNSGLPLRG